ncbi:epoxide hydrolase [Mesorhizobium sp. M9A.F.Ca.ET.002.03.1.2]|uniref:epoxide hydrolase family protein n=1 Tax=Mesorhizobium sp. M9A.F.Ca.ET.002.03.1.2 TaxID=2493668 RepID=UPI000F74E09B|nr:epoxide hydrolase family protein [Mesorhizobium sp. M9A.F.Ca.ET.002.03.1.2]AZO00842.1 epoxide hydrolase [Mesorhizobium sp. M9A.F.Ca.ET.002.03.1.2]
MESRPFTIHVTDEAIKDLHRRLRNGHWPDSIDADSWDDGTSLSFLKCLRDHWLHQFDWRMQECRLNRLPQYVSTIRGLDIHFVHQPGVGPAPMPLILTHGWPGSFVEMERIIPLLADPGAHGGDPADAFHVVVPSLPGYGFSQAPAVAGVSAREIAAMWRELMGGLGYDRFAAQGGDIGAGVSCWLARCFPESLLGVHLNYIPGSFRPGRDESTAPLSGEEMAFLDKAAAFAAAEGAYAALQATKPLTLAFALSDSPIGLAAWIAEKFRAWSDCGGELGRAIPIDTLLTDISIYWFSGNIAASLRLYKEMRLQPLTFEAGERVSVPFGVTVFPRELPMPPRSWVERAFNVVRWTHMPAGGHFAAIEQPEALAEEIRTFFRPLRSRCDI